MGDFLDEPVKYVDAGGVVREKDLTLKPVTGDVSLTQTGSKAFSGYTTTANDLGMIPAPLRDRMEIIELNSYTREEKFHIAKKHLIPKQLDLCGFSSKEIKFTQKAIYALIDYYTRESGVRTLEREIASLLRKCAVKKLDGEAETFKEALLGHADEPHGLVGHLTAGVGSGAVAVKTADIGSHIYADDVTLTQHPLTGDAVDHFVVDADAGTGGKSAVVQEGRSRTLRNNELVHSFVNLLGCYAGFYHIPCQGTGSRGNLSRPAHQFDLLTGFQGNHMFTSPKRSGSPV